MRKLIVHCRRLNDAPADAGVTTVEYAVAITAGAGFATILIMIARSDAVNAAITSLIMRALG